MTDPIRETRHYLFKFIVIFVLLSLPSFALRWDHPQPFGGFTTSKYQWIETVLHHPPPFRMALVGSSHIRTALDAPRISQELYGESDAVINFGVSWHGRGRDFLFAREILKFETVEKLVFEIPGYGESRMGSDYRSLFEDLGARVVSSPPPAELFVPENWFDREHLNVRGATLLSDWFVGQIRSPF